MKRRLSIWLVTLGLLAALGPLAAQVTGRDIMQKQKDLQISQDEFISNQMILVDKSGRQEQREIRHYSKEIEPDVTRTLIVFISPTDIKGTALLTWQHKEQEDDQWLYLPARGKLQRIAKGGRKNYFMGTDFTYEDLEPETIDDFQYTMLPEETLDNTPCYVIEAVAANQEKQRQSGYSKRALWISKDHYNTLKVEFYNRRDKLIKTQISRDWVNIKGTLWRARKTLMDNHQDQHKTIIGTIEHTVNEAIDEQTFTERFILNGQHTR